MAHAVSLILERGRFPLLHPLLRRGFWIRASAGACLRDILIRDLGLSQEAVRDRIQTVFLDGEVVDDFDAVFPGSGSTLALSPAMPGLLGASFRKGGAFAGLRGSITSKGRSPEPDREIGELRIKLYSLLTGEWGNILLDRGIMAEAGQISALVEERFSELRQALACVRVDGSEITPAELVEWLGSRAEGELIGLHLVEP
ncbi:MAG: hypothetical protein V5A14_05070 [Desulfohalobiaceae bacterium]